MEDGGIGERVSSSISSRMFIDAQELRHFGGGVLFAGDKYSRHILDFSVRKHYHVFIPLIGLTQRAQFCHQGRGTSARKVRNGRSQKAGFGWTFVGAGGWRFIGICLRFNIDGSCTFPFGWSLFLVFHYNLTRAFLLTSIWIRMRLKEEKVTNCKKVVPFICGHPVSKLAKVITYSY